MKFLQKLDEEFKLFHISDDGEIEEVDFNDLLSDLDANFKNTEKEDGEPSDELEFDLDLGSDQNSADLDDVESDNEEPEEDDSDDLDDLESDDDNYNANLAPNTDDGLADLPPEEDDGSDTPTKGELDTDSDFTGFDFDDDDDGDLDFDDDDDSDTGERDNLDLDDDEDDSSDFDFTDDENPDDTENSLGIYKTDDMTDDPTSDGADSGELGDTEPDEFDDFDDDDNDDLNFDGDEDDDDLDSDDFDKEDDEGDRDEEDPDFQGVIRTVKGACLVYKRMNPDDSTYEELWIYTNNESDKDMSKRFDTKRAILAGTDINPTDNESEDGQQNCEQSNIGNVVFLKITGLPS